MNIDSVESAPLLERLRFCQSEQTEVTLWLPGQQVTGVVTRLESGFVEVRSNQENALVRLQSISAIFYK